MKLTTKSEYSLLALIYIARNQNTGYVKVEKICSHYEIPKKYLEQLLLFLKQSRYLRAKRGAAGGYILNKKPNEITVAEIIRLMDGALAPVESVSKYFYTNTPLEKEKKVINIFMDIRNYVSDLLEKKTLADLI